MAKRPARRRFPLTDRGRLVRDGLLLLLFLLLIPILLQSFTFPTASLALRATQARYLFSADRVVSSADLPDQSRVYLLQSGRTYACAYVSRGALFWRSGPLYALEPGGEQPAEVRTDTGSDRVLVLFADGPSASAELEIPVSNRASERILFRVSVPLDPLEYATLAVLPPWGADQLPDLGACRIGVPADSTK